MVDFGKAKVLERQMPQTRNGIVGREFPVPDLLKQFAERFGVQALTQRSNLSIDRSLRLALEQKSAVGVGASQSFSANSAAVPSAFCVLGLLFYEASKASALLPDDGATRNRDAPWTRLAIRRSIALATYAASRP